MTFRSGLARSMLACLTLGAADAVAADPRSLTVVELFQSQGCSSCPPATLAHRDVVRSLVAIGTWRGAATRIALPAASDPAWRSAVLVQQGKGGPIIAAVRV